MGAVAGFGTFIVGQGSKKSILPFTLTHNSIKRHQPYNNQRPTTANAPVSKGLCLLVVGASVLANYAGVSRRMTLGAFACCVQRLLAATHPYITHTWGYSSMINIIFYTSSYINHPHPKSPNNRRAPHHARGGVAARDEPAGLPGAPPDVFWRPPPLHLPAVRAPCA